MTFHVGQKVVCVDANGCLMGGLTEGQIYTVRWQGMHSYWPEHRKFGQPPLLCIKLAEIVRPATYPNSQPDIPYSVTRFRPAVERKTDTGMAILEEIRKRESVPAPGKKVAVASTN